jgi:hypothetical protein
MKALLRGIVGALALAALAGAQPADGRPAQPGPSGWSSRATVPGRGRCTRSPLPAERSRS